MGRIVRRGLWLLVVTALLVAAVSWLDLVGGAGRTDEAALAPPIPPAEARTLLDGLPTAPRAGEGPPYQREAFGRRWADVDGNGCNQRDDVLRRDAVPGEVTTRPQDACPHDVVAGTWLDPYTGAELTFDDLKELDQAQAIQIDHVVPLAEAWRSGAEGWSAQRRERFANDLGVLLAVDGPANMAKGDDDPADWRPREDVRCAYAALWVRVKADWDLAVDPSERRALAEMLDTCP